jgi:hypothetical protein
MLTKNDFSPADWSAVRDVPHLVGLATLLAGSSGLGTVKESVAIAHGLVEGQSSDLALIRDLTNRAEMQSAQASLRETLGGLEATVSKDRVKSLALERVTNALSVLNKTGHAEEVLEFRRWLYGIAEKVARAAKEGGFLGFGGTLVSEDEQAFLNELRTTLQLQAGTS